MSITMCDHRWMCTLCAIGTMFQAIIWLCVCVSSDGISHPFSTAFWSTNTNMLNFIQYLSSIFSNNLQVDVIYTDFAKGLDMADNGLFCDKLYEYRFWGITRFASALCILLKNWYQYAMYGSIPTGRLVAQSWAKEGWN